MSDWRSHLGEWRGLPAVRNRLANEGFLLPELHADTVSKFCGREFTPAEYLAEFDERGYDLIKCGLSPGIASTLPVPPSTLDEAFSRRLQSTEATKQNRELFGVIEEQKVRELRLIPLLSDKILSKQADVRDFAFGVGKEIGWSVERRKFHRLSPICVKKLAKSGLLGFFGFDVGGKSHSWEGMPTPFVMSSFLGEAVEFGKLIGLNIAQIVCGVGEYNSYFGSIDPYAADRAISSVPDEFWSDMVKLGATAWVRCFDIILDEIDASFG